MKTSAAVLGLSFGLAMFGCSGTVATQGEELIDSDDAADSLAETSTYFIFSSRDLKKCMWPVCGGDYVKRVNRPSTKCVDGKLAPTCYVSSIDLSAIGLSEEEATKLTSGFESGLVILRGKIESRAVSAGSTLKATYLVASEAWVGQSAKAPTGLFYNVTDSGIRCIAAPCKSIHEARLNSSLDQELAGVDFAASGANSKQVDAANAALATEDGVIVAGSNYSVTGPAGKANALKASEFYLRAKPAKAQTTCPDESVKGVSYISHDPKKCMLVKFFCADGGSAFGGECGCGCLPKGMTQCGDKFCADGETCNELESFPVQYKCTASKK